MMEFCCLWQVVCSDHQRLFGGSVLRDDSTALLVRLPLLWTRRGGVCGAAMLDENKE